MARNLVMCLDGTAGQVQGPRSKNGESNVVLLHDLLDRSDDTLQLAFYDPGVGTFASSAAWSPLARWFSRLGGNIWGAGVRENLGDAYLWLMRNWQPGDRIYLFGFSRGAFTARALTGMLRTVGLLRPGAENLVPYVISVYARRGASDVSWDAIHRYAELFAHRVDGRTTIPVAYLGIWDTVKALGVFRMAPQWPYTRTLPNAQRIRHVISIDERRRPFAEYLVQRDDERDCDEQWFAGVHCDVGGTFKDDPRLSTIALKWMIEGALQADPNPTTALRVRRRKYNALVASVVTSHAEGKQHRNSWVWNLLIPRRRRIAPDAVIHSSVRARLAAVPEYRPHLPAQPVWGDPGWAADG